MQRVLCYQWRSLFFYAHNASKYAVFFSYFEKRAIFASDFCNVKVALGCICKGKTPIKHL